MKLKIKLLFIISAIFFVFTGYSQSYINNDKFSITFPVEPILNEQDVTNDHGTFKMYAYMTEGTDGIYMLSYIDYTESFMNSNPASTFFQNAMTGFTNSLEITVSEQNNISKSGYSGHSYKASGGRYNYFCVKYDYIVKNRFYQLGILRTDRDPTSYEISSFFDSFTLKGSVSNNNNNNNNISNNTKEIKRPEPLPE